MKYLFSFLCLCCVLSVSAQKPVVINLAKAISESPKDNVKRVGFRYQVCAFGDNR